MCSMIIHIDRVLIGSILCRNFGGCGAVAEDFYLVDDVITVIIVQRHICWPFDWYSSIEDELWETLVVECDMFRLDKSLS